MVRIDEALAAKAYVEKLAVGGFPLDRSKNGAEDYCKVKEARDTEAVRDFTKSVLFKQFKQIE